MIDRRKDRLASYLRDQLPKFIATELDLPKGSMVSVLYVDMTESKQKANIFVSIYPDNFREVIAKELKLSENRAAHFIRVKLGSKFSPVIRFRVLGSDAFVHRENDQ